MTRTEREAYWREHVEAARSHPGSLAAYCRETELCNQSLLNWKRRFGTALPFIELDPPPASPFQGLRLELGGIRVDLPPDCAAEWAEAFVAAIHQALEEQPR